MGRKIILILVLLVSHVFIENSWGNEPEIQVTASTKTNRIDPNLEPIVKSLVSENEDDFWTGIEAACMLSERGSNKGVLAIQEAIIRKSRNKDCKFYKPKITKRDIEAYKNAGDELIELAKKGTLLEDTYRSGDLVSAYNAFYGGKKIQELSEKVRTIGGEEQYRAFILLFNDMWCFIQSKKHERKP